MAEADQLSYPYVKVGEEATVTTTLPNPGMPGQPLTVAGELLAYDLDDSGALRVLVLDTKEDTAPLVIPATTILLWRMGSPIQVNANQRQIVVPFQVPPGMLDPNHRQQ